jgi:hypothetical protein
MSRFNRSHHGLENLCTVRAADSFVASPVGVRHQTENISFAITNAGNVLNGTIRIRFGHDMTTVIGVSHNDASIFVELAQCLVVREVTSFTMGDWHSKQRSFRATMRERGVRDFNS